MTIGEPVIEGEDVPIQVVYTDSSGNPVAPDGVSGGSGPTITITGPNETTLANATVMTEVETGTYEHVLDTSSDSVSNGVYNVSVTAELSSETKIVVGNFRVV
jgi:hypothetical protein